MREEKDWLKELAHDQGVEDEKSWLERGYTYAELQQADLPDPEWLIPTLIPNPGLVAITGRPGHFKTFFAQWLSLRLSAHKPLFEDLTEFNAYKEPVGVVFVEEEMNARQIKQRTNDMRSWEHENFHWFISTGFSLKKEEKVAELRKFIEENNIKLLIFDPFTTVAEMKDENSNSEAREVMDTIRHEFVDTEHGCTVIFIHHPAKGEGSSENIRGAGDILGKCDMHFVIEKRNPDDRRDTSIQIKCKKTRYEAPDDFYAEMVENPDDMGKLEWVYRGNVISEYQKERNDLKEIILEAMDNDEEYSQKEVAEIIGENKNNKKFRASWTQLIEENLIEQISRYSWKKR